VYLTAEIVSLLSFATAPIGGVVDSNLRGMWGFLWGRILDMCPITSLVRHKFAITTLFKVVIIELNDLLVVENRLTAMIYVDI
jgi:hypothetical protein